ncbi:MAG TPA: sugar phosphate isomerase/epimerase [Terriglobales bacterium]|nr:sugar phosphate isomerase/epimerase [Terriglobales bacterium]
MLSRREFLEFSLTAAAGLSATRLLAAERRPVGVQLYTVRQDAARDLPAVLTAIRQIGYSEVETYWDIYNHPAADLRRMIADHGLSVPSGHFDYQGLESKIEYAKLLGVEYVICPMLPESMWVTLDAYKQAADQFNRWGEQIRQAGMQFGFHNHNYEFRRFGDTTGFETLMKRCDPKLVCIEMDCYWITQAGLDPLQMFRQYGDRIQLLHLKDRKPGFPVTQIKDAAAEHFTEVGAGTLHWPEILAAAGKNGVKHMFVERDSGDLPAMESLRISFANLQKMQ